MKKPFFHLYDLVLGGQDGLVNVFGLILGVASATFDTKLVIIAGIVGAFAEAFSMGAVAFTSAKTEKESIPKKLKKVCAPIVREFENPGKDAIVVGMASLIAALIPLWPFFFMRVKSAMIAATITAVIMLGTLGTVRALKAKKSIWKQALETTSIGLAAALAGYFVGFLLNKWFR